MLSLPDEYIKPGKATPKLSKDSRMKLKAFKSGDTIVQDFSFTQAYDKAAEGTTLYTESTSLSEVFEDCRDGISSSKLENWLCAVGGDWRRLTGYYINKVEHDPPSTLESDVDGMLDGVASSTSDALVGLMTKLSKSRPFGLLFSKDLKMLSWLMDELTDSRLECLVNIVSTCSSNFMESLTPEFLKIVMESLLDPNLETRGYYMTLLAVIASTSKGKNLIQNSSTSQLFQSLIGDLGHQDPTFFGSALTILVETVQDPNVRVNLFSESNAFKICRLILGAFEKGQENMGLLFSCLARDCSISASVQKFLGLYWDEWVIVWLSKPDANVVCASSFLSTVLELCVAFPESMFTMTMMNALNNAKLFDYLGMCNIQQSSVLTKDTYALMTLWSKAIRFGEMCSERRIGKEFVDMLLDSFQSVFVSVGSFLSRDILSLSLIKSQVFELLEMSTRLTILGFQSNSFDITSEFIESLWQSSKAKGEDQCFQILMMAFVLLPSRSRQTHLVEFCKSSSKAKCLETFMNQSKTSDDPIKSYIAKTLDFKDPKQSRANAQHEAQIPATFMDLKQLKEELEEAAKSFQKTLSIQSTMSMEQVRVLETKVQELEDSRNRDSHIITQFEKRLSEKETVVKSSRGQVLELNGVIESLRDELELKNEQNVEVHEALSKLKSEIKSLEKAHQKATLCLEDRHLNQVSALESQLASMTLKMNGLVDQNQSLLMKCEEDAERIQGLEAELEEQEEEYDNMVSKLAQNLKNRKHRGRGEATPLPA